MDPGWLGELACVWSYWAHGFKFWLAHVELGTKQLLSTAGKSVLHGCGECAPFAAEL